MEGNSCEQMVDVKWLFINLLYHPRIRLFSNFNRVHGHPHFVGKFIWLVVSHSSSLPSSSFLSSSRVTQCCVYSICSFLELFKYISSIFLAFLLRNQLDPVFISEFISSGERKVWKSCWSLSGIRTVWTAYSGATGASCLCQVVGMALLLSGATRHSTGKPSLSTCLTDYLGKYKIDELFRISFV